MSLPETAWRIPFYGAVAKGAARLRTDPDPTGMRMTMDDGSPGVAVGDSECLEEKEKGIEDFFCSTALTSTHWSAAPSRGKKSHFSKFGNLSKLK